MELYLMRHGEAFDSLADPTRPLTEQGRTQVVEVARQALEQGMSATHLYHSGILRAQQTAELLAETLGFTGSLERRADLQPESDPEPIVRWCLEHAGAVPADGIVLVGHLPFMDRLAARLLSSMQPTPNPRFPPAGLARLVATPDGRRFELDWMLTP